MPGVFYWEFEMCDYHKVKNYAEYEALSRDERDSWHLCEGWGLIVGLTDEDYDDFAKWSLNYKVREEIERCSGANI